MISRRTLQFLAKYVDPNVQLDDETEDMLLSYSDEFMEQVMEGACKLAAHRKAPAVEVQDIEAYLGKQLYNNYTPTISPAFNITTLIAVITLNYISTNFTERHHNMWISNEQKDEPSKLQKKSQSTDAHKQRVALIKKTLKKY